MTEISITTTDLDGDACRRAVTTLLLAARGDDPLAGLWEAGDLQWWWTVDNERSTRHDTFWLDDSKQPIACLLSGQLDRVTYTEFLWRPSLRPDLRDRIVTAVVDRLAEVRSTPDMQVWITVDERDGSLRHHLEARNFRHEPDDDMVQMWWQMEEPPGPVRLQDGMTFADVRSRDPKTPHHLAKRNGEDIAQRLMEQSLYRPDLDLCIQTASGDVAAYCLCWLDPINGVGLFEPMRTEDAYQRQGLGRALMTEGIRRLAQQGAGLIKVSRDRTNQAAEHLYTSVGFANGNRKMRYVGD